MRSQGNTSAGGNHDRSRPLPSAPTGSRPAHQVHETARRPSGLDWSQLLPACKSCGQKSGQVNSETGVCRSCAGRPDDAPANPTPAADPTPPDGGGGGDSWTDNDDTGGDDMDDPTGPDHHADDTDPGDGQRLIDVLVAELHPDPENPREGVGDITDLAASMRTAGLLQPIVARRTPVDGRHQLVVVAGHRRLAAAKSLGWSRVACVVRRDMAADEVLAAMLIENGQRAGLGPIEEARALRRLASDGRGRTHAQVGALVGRHQTHVSGRMALLELTVEDQEAIRAGRMNVGDGIRRGRVTSGRVRPAGSTGAPHLGVEHELARKAAARCKHLGHNKAGRNSVGGVACGACWESVIRADERTHLHDVSNRRGRCVLCDTATTQGGAV